MQSDTHAFIVRIWHEELNGAGNVAVWRGSIDHVASGERLYFCDLGGVVRFIQEQANLDGGRRGSRWKALLTRIRYAIM